MNFLEILSSFLCILIGGLFFFRPSTLEMRYKEFLDDKVFVKKVHKQSKIIGIMFFSVGLLLFVLSIFQIV